MSSIFRLYLFILFSFNFLQNCRSSAGFHLSGVQDLTKDTREGEERRRRRQPPSFCGRALRGAMAEEAVLPFEVLENVKQLNGPVMELELQLRVLLKSCRRQSLSLLTPVERASTFLCLSKALTTLFSCMLVIHSYFPILLLFPQTIACSFLCSEACFGPSGNQELLVRKSVTILSGFCRSRFLGFRV
jgi:hypothetical protein